MTHRVWFFHSSHHLPTVYSCCTYLRWQSSTRCLPKVLWRITVTHIYRTFHHLPTDIVTCLPMYIRVVPTSLSNCYMASPKFFDDSLWLISTVLPTTYLRISYHVYLHICVVTTCKSNSKVLWWLTVTNWSRNDCPRMLRAILATIATMLDPWKMSQY